MNFGQLIKTEMHWQQRQRMDRFERVNREINDWGPGPGDGEGFA